MPPLALAAAEGPGRRAADRIAAVPICDVVVAAELLKRRREQERAAAGPKKLKLADLGAPKNALRIRWPTRFRRAMDLEDEPNVKLMTADPCLYGLEAWSKDQIIKDTAARTRTKFMTNPSGLAQGLNRRCNGAP